MDEEVKIASVTPPVTPKSDFSYGVGSDTLDYNTALRNKPAATGTGNVFVGTFYASRNGSGIQTLSNLYCSDATLAELCDVQSTTDTGLKFNRAGLVIVSGAMQFNPNTTGDVSAYVCRSASPYSSISTILSYSGYASVWGFARYFTVPYAWAVVVASTEALALDSAAQWGAATGWLTFTFYET